MPTAAILAPPPIDLRMTLGSLIAQGGPVMVVLLALSVIATAIIVLKAAELLRLRLAARGTLDVLREAARVRGQE